MSILLRYAYNNIAVIYTFCLDSRKLKERKGREIEGQQILYLDIKLGGKGNGRIYLHVLKQTNLDLK